MESNTRTALSLDVIALGHREGDWARDCYAAALAPVVADRGGHTELVLRGAGGFELHDDQTLAASAGVDAATTGFRGYVISCVVEQPSEVDAVLDAAAAAGATILKPGKKSMFAGFSGVFRAPDGAVWKVSSPHRKDTGIPADPPEPTELGLILAVADPKASKDFYTAVGMLVDRDYGAKYLDFTAADGSVRLCLMPRAALAKDAGVGADGSGWGALVMRHRAESRETVDTLVAAAVEAGGRVSAPAGPSADGYAGHVADPDGHLWRIEAD